MAGTLPSVRLASFLLRCKRQILGATPRRLGHATRMHSPGSSVVRRRQTRALTHIRPSTWHLAAQVGVVVLGAGPTGLGAATRLHQHGYEDWLLIDQVRACGGGGICAGSPAAPMKAGGEV